MAIFETEFLTRYDFYLSIITYLPQSEHDISQSSQLHGDVYTDREPPPTSTTLWCRLSQPSKVLTYLWPKIQFHFELSPPTYRETFDSWYKGYSSKRLKKNPKWFNESKLSLDDDLEPNWAICVEKKHKSYLRARYFWSKNGPKSLLIK